MIHPDTRLQWVSETIGFGVVATGFIPAGTITWVQDSLDREVSQESFASLAPELQNKLSRYVFRNPGGNLVLCWDIARYMNHSCNPACMGTENGYEVALRDIHPGEELTVDYAALFPDQDDAFQCFCLESTCRGFVGPEDYFRLRPVWDNQLSTAFGLLPIVSQPLLSLLPQEIRAGLFPGSGIKQTA